MFCAGVALHVLLYRTNGAVVWDWKILSLYNFEFMLGVLAYQYRPPGGAMVLALLIVGGLALFVATSTVCAGLLPPSREVPVFALDMLGLWRVLGFGGASFLTLAGLVSLERTGMFDRIGAAGAQGLAAAAAVGDASYSIYLIHNLFLTAAGRVLARHVDSVQVFLLVAAVAAVVVCGVGIIFHRLVERPLVRICERDLVPWLLGATRREARA
jgi:peptidoglycan/LPS O-acetylase OafA/YrhL